MLKYFKLAVVIATGCFLASCAEQTPAGFTIQSARAHRVANVRTTAYARGERGGGRNAVGEYLSGRHVMSAASDWSRFPLGTRFRIADTKDEYVIDDYGTALIGTSTIDLFKRSRPEVRRWGVRRVDIEILQWGSNEQSLKVLAARKKHPSVRRMIAALEKQASIPRALD